ncbi:hypothetical protein OF117_01045 [Geodermatophilus sp. YIM 151500]|uniref:hypothetical protein n=1 Tax=Geodermatophilus sp. YIM 151500 TaxID=2984531 RepID=UPI0021E382D2|nr:hypothetical protein [Geodermatophilus sp. YIM 151500]MCV2487934.1 hypothetical protein [Geodermatophilus sp. YIM 151500]
MSAAAVVLLVLTAAGGLVLSAWGERLRPPWGAAVLVVALAGAAGSGWGPGRAGQGLGEVAVLCAVLAAVAGGGPVATAVLRFADPTEAGVPAEGRGGPGDPDILRGGAWIGVLERAAVAGTLLAGWPEGLAVVLAVKGLGRYNELRTTPAAAERFILGTLASALWAAACVGVAFLVRR